MQQQYNVVYPVRRRRLTHEQASAACKIYIYICRAAHCNIYLLHAFRERARGKGYDPKSAGRHLFSLCVCVCWVGASIYTFCGRALRNQIHANKICERGAAMSWPSVGRPKIEREKKKSYKNLATIPATNIFKTHHYIAIRVGDCTVLHNTFICIHLAAEWMRGMCSTADRRRRVILTCVVWVPDSRESSSPKQ